MNQTTTNELKSEKLKLGKVFLIIWLVAVVAFFSFAAVKYAGYKEIQDAGLVCAALASSEYDSPDREEVIHDLYMDMTRTSYLGQNWNEYSGAIRDAMEDALEAMGYDDLTYIPHYFRYVGFSEYFMGYFLFSHAPVLMLCIYAVLLVLLIFTVSFTISRASAAAISMSLRTEPSSRPRPIWVPLSQAMRPMAKKPSTMWIASACNLRKAACKSAICSWRRPAG